MKTSIVEHLNVIQYPLTMYYSDCVPEQLDHTHGIRIYMMINTNSEGIIRIEVIFTEFN